MKKRFIDPPTEAHKKVARALVQGGASLADALEAGGFSPKQARKGKKLLESRPVLQKAILDEWNKLEKKHGPAIANPKLRERAVLTRLMDNIVTGRDRAVGSAKLLGQHRDTNMWSPESMTGLLIIDSPREPLPQLPQLQEQDNSDGLNRGRFFSVLQEDVSWRNSAEGQEARKRLEARGEL